MGRAYRTPAVTASSPLLVRVRDFSQLCNGRAPTEGAGHSSCMAALSSAPSIMAKSAENAYSRNAIGVASAPYV